MMMNVDNLESTHALFYSRRMLQVGNYKKMYWLLQSTLTQCSHKVRDICWTYAYDFTLQENEHFD